MIQSINPLAIASIEVDKLFGRYTYRLKGNDDIRAHDISQIMLLCGNNGSGKTTILNLIVHLLWPQDGGGHRSAIAGIPFSRFAVTLMNGVSIVAERGGDELIGNFNCYILRDGIKVIDVEFLAKEDKRGGFSVDVEEESQFTRLTEVLSEIGLSIYFLDDDRTLVSAEIPSAGTKRDVSFDDESLLMPSGTKKQLRDMEQQKRNAQLLSSIERLIQWSRRQLISDSNKADASSQNIYEEIIEGIGRTTDTTLPDEKQRSNLLHRLQTVSERVRPFAELGLSPEFEAKAIQRALGKVQVERLPLIEGILTPYIDGIELRMNALQKVQEALGSYVANLNAFLVDKRVTFDVYSGLQVFPKGEGGARIDPLKLSSGEKQLVLLLSNVISTSSQSTVFIIDEPELSLNVEWQRILVSALLDCSRGSNVQFIVATHSMELISQHISHVLQLVSNK